MTHTDVVRRIIGNVRPIGETNHDNESFENLKDMSVLLSDLIDELVIVSNQKNRYEFSCKRSGEFAYEVLKGIKEHIEDTIS